MHLVLLVSVVFDIFLVSFLLSLKTNVSIVSIEQVFLLLTLKKKMFAGDDLRFRFGQIFFAILKILLGIWVWTQNAVTKTCFLSENRRNNQKPETLLDES